MIKANELRLGNYFFDEDGNEKKIGYSDLVSLTITVLHFNPIPLTPEILERCGFNYWQDAIPKPYWKTKKGFPLYTTKDYFIVRDLTHTNMGKVKYLHQLQNLYHALTGEELEIKELQHA